MLQFLIKQGYDVSAHEQKSTWSCLAQFNEGLMNHFNSKTLTWSLTAKVWWSRTEDNGK
jgi:hypothetical protein